ncbi:site-specific integrase [Maribacter ulvicola]|uniref:Phage integrase family protein n=1 Tax=Maribacter ulvicola TaxID=228959 RepID=A0A1N6QFI4_9FLAO|nr:hypothetical protein [Maribacter ulvicola]SIQ15302.1 hypothetical protein SAMN05421797_101870 [Maribacter ulvicola]
MSTHIGRRTFATIHYSELDNAFIMAVTGHKKESSFLKYVNKSNDSHVDPIMHYY